MQCGGEREEWAIVLLHMLMKAPYRRWSVWTRCRTIHTSQSLHYAMVERGIVVLYQPPRSTAIWGAEYTTALDAIKSSCECNVQWRPHVVYRPKAVLSPEVTAVNVGSLGKVVRSPLWCG